jgi:hypothetical protein
MKLFQNWEQMALFARDENHFEAQTKKIANQDKLR